MNFAEAVALAKSGNEAGFNFLYEETYKSKYYLALKYMQNEEAAKDVVQDAYIRAFSKLDTLEKPETFASWLGMIVANVAKNALQKKKPMLFADIARNSEEEEFEYQIEDESLQNQPEIAYSQKETQELVHELIDTLSEEQRMCILMFHIEGQSISEIARILGCSENTVKSRLNYGRKNIKRKAEELQKKGYKLYGVAPVPLLLYLLNAEEQALAAQGALEATGRTMAANLTARMTTEAVKKGFIYTLAGKLTMAGIGICLTAGVAIVAINGQKDNSEPASVFVEEENNKNDGNAENDKTQEEQTLKQEEKAKTEETEVDVMDEQYPDILEGGLTKEEFVFALAYGPKNVAGGEVSQSTLESLLFRVHMTGEYYNLGINSIEPEEPGRKTYRLEDMNRYISVFTSYQFNEADSDTYEHIWVSGDKITFLITEPAETNNVTIQKAAIKGDVMKVEYDFENMHEERGINTTKKVATLHKTESGRFRVTDIVDVGIPEEGSESRSL